MAVLQTEVWTIDEVAQRAGCSVDTVRFYTRQGLLPEIERRGRSVLYGPVHLDRLKQIQNLQGRHFTLASIKDLVEDNRLDIMESFFGTPERTLTRDELVYESGLSSDVVDQLESLGYLPASKDRGAVEYDGDDLRALRSVGELLGRGMPMEVLVVLLQTYLQQMATLKRKLLTTFMDTANISPDLSEADVEQFITAAANNIDELISVFDLVVQYLHRRTLQSLLVDAIEVGLEDDEEQ
jgi:DNA-binding transcriptional MerR regulator